MKRSIMKRLVPVLLLSSFLFLSGCASLDYVQGTKVSNDQLTKFTIEKTTKDEVIAALGGPQDIKFEGGKQILIYRYQRITANPFAANEGFDTTSIFNDRNILKDILKSRGSSQPNPLTGR
jgi:hypothetical protein